MATVSPPSSPIKARVSLFPDSMMKGSYAYYLDTIDAIYHNVMEFLRINYQWLKETGGQKTLFIKFPEVIVKLSNRIGPSTNLPGKLLNNFAYYAQPFVNLGECAKTFLSCVEVVTKLEGVFYPSKAPIDYVVVNEKDESFKAQLSIEEWVPFNRIQSAADWMLSLAECEVYLRGGDRGAAYSSPFATWGSRYMSIKGLCFEGWFLYKTQWLGQPTRYNSATKKDEIVSISRVCVAGSMLKISLALVCLSLDLFNTLGSKVNKPVWLETAMFCAGIAPTFITPMAFKYWPRMVVEPLYKAAAAG
jgi:hypothetical protein